MAGSTSINDSNSTSQPASAARTASANQPAEFKPAHKLLALTTIFLTSILICFLIFKLAYPALGIEKDAAAEKLSVPIQQITRVVAIHPERLTEEDMVEIEKFIPAENLTDLRATDFRSSKSRFQQRILRSKLQPVLEPLASYRQSQ